MKMIRQLASAIPILLLNSMVFISKKIGIFFSFGEYLFKNIKSFFKDTNSVIREGLVALLICAIGDLIAGIILGKMTFFLETFPGLLVLIPGAIGMRGNIFGALGSRLGSNLHIGILSPELKKSKILNENIFSSIILTLILSIFLAILAKAICILFNFHSMDLIDFLLISIFTGLISSFIMLPITLIISLKSFEHGWDPDNIVNPLIAALGDVFTLPSIILSLLILSFFNNSLIKYFIGIILVVLILYVFYKGFKSNASMKKILKQSSPVLLFSSILGVSAGGILNSAVSTLLTNPTLLTLVPLFSGESGSLVSVLGARLSSSLHSGLIEPILKPNKETLRNFAIILVLAILIYPFIGLLAEGFSSFYVHVGLGMTKTILISFISGISLILIMMLFVFSLSSLSYRRGYDPDNIVIPLSTSVTDLVSNLILLFVSLLFISSVI
ncbi:MAG: magnesium transporter [Methanobrevibacter sp.]|jgi:mgtE-like transporter|nr:magnesium transporter [Methanobrevibacter sp.]